MEIYKLSDSIDNNAILRGGFDNGVKKLKITSLKQGVKNPNRVNVFVNSKYEFSLDIAQIVDFKLRVGMEITAEQFLELKKASEFGRLYQRTLEWVLIRPRSKKEVQDYLYRKVYEKGLDKIYIDRIIERLENKKHLSDAVFAEWYVENRFVRKGVSGRRLKIELMKKGISKEIIEGVLRESERDDEKEARKIIMKKRNKYDDEKLIQYLCRQGFSFELASELVRSCGKD